MHLNEIEMADSDFSVQELKKQLFTSLQCTGILDSLKSQLRARLLDHLREQDGSLLENKDKDRKPSVTERLLSSLFLDYLNSYGYAFTQSVFLPESRMVSCPPYTYHETLELLHLDSTPNFNRRLKITPDGKRCLMQQLVTALQKFSFRINTHDVSIQTQDLDSCLREIDNACNKKQEAERRLAFRSLEDRFNAFRQEFEKRVNGEVALQVNRVREYEMNALRMEEACRYRRQLARDREELEELHKGRLVRIHEREESLMQRLLVKEKANEAAGYEQRQKLLADITNLRDREDKLQGREEQQVRREEKLAEQEKYLKQREEDICHMRETLYARVDESAAMKIKELEDQYRTKNERLQSDRSLLEDNWAAFHEEKARLENELRAAKVDKELVISLHERLASDGDQRQLLVEQIENICQEQKQKWGHEQKRMQRTIQKLEADLKKAVEENEGVVRSRKGLQLQLRQSESELLDTVTLLKKTQHALELERLQHYSLRSQIATGDDKLQERKAGAKLTGHQTVELKEGILRNYCEPGAVERTSRPGRHLAMEAGKHSAEMARHQHSPPQNVVRTKSHSRTSPQPYLEKSLVAQGSKIVRNSFSRETVLDEVRVHHDHSRTFDGVRPSSLCGERGESSSTGIGSTSSKSKQATLSVGQRWGENYSERTAKDCFHSTTSEVSSLTSNQSVGGEQMNSLPTTSRIIPHRVMQKKTSAPSWEPNQSSTNYYMMGATSFKSSTSALEFKMMGKAVKLSTSVDHDQNERRHTEVYETNIQTNIQKKTAETEGDRERWDLVAPETREQSTILQPRIEESEWRSKLLYDDNQACEDTFRPDSSVAKRNQTLRKDLFGEQQELLHVNTEKDKRRPRSRTSETWEQRDGENTSNAQPSFSALSTDVESNMTPEIAVASFQQNRISKSYHAPPPDDTDREKNSGLSAMVLEDLKRFSQQLEATKSLVDTEKPPDLDSLELRTWNDLGNSGVVKWGRDEQQEELLHKADEMELTTARELLGEIDLLARASQAHNSFVPEQQKEDFERLSLSSGHCCSRTLTFQNVTGRRSTQETNNREGANSEESCSNPSIRAPKAKNTPEGSSAREIDPEAYKNTVKQDTQKWDVQSEQGSHNPGEENTEWVDDYATGDTDQYAEYSDAFSVPESNNTTSNESATACYS